VGGRLPVVHSLSMADFGPGYGRIEDRVFRSIERVLARWTAAYAVVGQDLARRFEANGTPPEKLNVVRSGAPLPPPDLTPAIARRRLEQRFGIPIGPPVIAYVGSLEERKNVLALPELHAAVGDQFDRDVLLVVAGDGPLRDPLQDRLGLRGQTDSVRLLGHVDGVDDVIVGADVLVLLSSAEGLPQVLVQAAAAGTPFVASDVDGVAELLDLGAEGVAVPLGDVAAAATATVRYLTASAHGGRRFRQEGKDREWSPDAITRGHRAIFERVMGRSLDDDLVGVASTLLGAGS
jgi:glycosyltransferase involved in cell wall biosynthesis